VGMTGSASPPRVLVEQRLRLTGQGDYQVRERGPARASEALGDEPPPVTKFGAVVWQGFSPGSRELAARLTLDPLLEAPAPARCGSRRRTRAAAGARAARCPARHRAAHADQRDRAAGDAPDGRGRPARRWRRRWTRHAAARSPRPARGCRPRGRAARGGARHGAGAGAGRHRRAAARDGHPAGERAPGHRARRPPRAGRRDVAGTLPPGCVRRAAGGGRGLDPAGPRPDGCPALDPRAAGARPAGPPPGRPGPRGPDARRRRSALDLLVATAATGAAPRRTRPYLGADLPGTGSTRFRYAFAAPEQVEQVAAALEPRRARSRWPLRRAAAAGRATACLLLAPELSSEQGRGRAAAPAAARAPGRCCGRCRPPGRPARRRGRPRPPGTSRCSPGPRPRGRASAPTPARDEQRGPVVDVARARRRRGRDDRAGPQPLGVPRRRPTPRTARPWPAAARRGRSGTTAACGCPSTCHS
jgi:hypothetical protein